MKDKIETMIKAWRDAQTQSIQDSRYYAGAADAAIEILKLVGCEGDCENCESSCEKENEESSN
jgi:hypothetical protein